MTGKLDERRKREGDWREKKIYTNTIESSIYTKGIVVEFYHGKQESNGKTTSESMQDKALGKRIRWNILN